MERRKQSSSSPLETILKIGLVAIGGIAAGFFAAKVIEKQEERVQVEAV